MPFGDGPSDFHGGDDTKNMRNSGTHMLDYVNWHNRARILEGKPLSRSESAKAIAMKRTLERRTKRVLREMARYQAREQFLTLLALRRAQLESSGEGA